MSETKILSILVTWQIAMRDCDERMDQLSEISGLSVRRCGISHELNGVRSTSG